MENKPKEGQPLQVADVHSKDLGSFSQGKLTVALPPRSVSVVELTGVNGEVLQTYEQIEFDDTISDWAIVPATKMYNHGFLEKESLSQLDSPLERQELAKLVVNLYQKITKSRLPEGRGDTFTDLNNTEYEKYINEAVQLKLMQGIGDGWFDPFRAATRQEICVVIANLLHAIDPQKEITLQDVTDFIDSHDIEDWAMSSVAYLYKNNIVSGMPGGWFRPLENVTKEQAITMLYRFCIHISLIKA